jgi:hypothetical protein
MSYKTIHENELFAGLLNIAVDGIDNVTSKIFADTKNVNSINRSAKDFVLTFPVFVSDSLDKNSMMTVASALERKYANLLLILFNSMNDLSDSDVKSYIRKFHINMNDEYDIQHITKIAESMYEYAQRLDPLFNAKQNTSMKAIMADLKNNTDYVLPHSVSECGINGVVDMINESKNKKGMKSFKDLKGYRDELAAKEEATKASSKNDKKPKSNNKDADPVGDIVKSKVDTSKPSSYHTKASLTPSDCKKANEMTPTIITIQYYSTKQSEVTRQFMVGVKAKIYPIDSDTIVSKLMNADRNRGILNFIRATTREISFAKDFLFTIDALKKDAIRAARNRESMKDWKRLENRSRLVKINRITGMNLAQAISTVVITQNDADRLAEYDINMDNPGVVSYIMNKYSLLGMVIVDQEYELIKLMFDGDRGLEEMTLKSLKKSNPAKDLVTLLGKSI